MVFKGVDNQSVELRITNYQFPNSNNGDWDSNWLNIYLNVKSKIGHWQTVDSSLTTWEFSWLITWFYKLSINEIPELSDASFTEPNLSFELLDNNSLSLKVFRIKFDYESRPKSAEEGEEFFVDCAASMDELERIVIDLRKELDKFPERK